MSQCSERYLTVKKKKEIIKKMIFNKCLVRWSLYSVTYKSRGLYILIYVSLYVYKP